MRPSAFTFGRNDQHICFSPFWQCLVSATSSLLSSCWLGKFSFLSVINNKSIITREERRVPRNWSVLSAVQCCALIMLPRLVAACLETIQMPDYIGCTHALWTSLNIALILVCTVQYIFELVTVFLLLLQLLIFDQLVWWQCSVIKRVFSSHETKLKVVESRQWRDRGWDESNLPLSIIDLQLANHFTPWYGNFFTV